MSAAVSPIQRKLKYLANINDEVLGEDTDPDFEILYIDIGNVESSGIIGEVSAYRFEDSPSRARRRVRDGDVIISTVRTYLQAIAQVQSPPENMIASTGFAVVRPLPEFDVNYCKYVLREQWFLSEVEKRSVGVSYPAINAIDLANIPLHIHPLTQQRAIADYLDRETAQLDALVAAKQRLLDLLAEKRHALITHAVTNGLDTVVDVRETQTPITSRDWWFGSMPKDWQSLPLKYLCEKNSLYGANISSNSYESHGVRFIRTSDISDDGVLYPEGVNIAQYLVEDYMLNDGDFLISRSGTIGRSLIYKKEMGPCAYAGYLIRYILKSNTSPHWLFYVTKSEGFEQWLSSVVIEATIGNVNGEKYANMLLPLPPLAQQHAIADYLDCETARLDELAAKTRETIALLKERRAALVTAAVTGQIDVEDAA